MEFLRGRTRVCTPVCLITLQIIPPKEWVPRKGGYDIEELGKIKIPDPITQDVNGNRGIYQSINIRKNAMSVKKLKDLAISNKYRPPPFRDYEDLERKYWKNLTFVPAIYGADVPGTITDDDVDEWNIQRLGSILDRVNEDYKIKITGVNTAYLYFGMWKASFAWHTEDMDLHSINFLHYGDAKFWYTIPPEYARRFERMAAGLFPNLEKECPAYLRHKMCMISPNLLRQNSIPYNKIVQKEGEIMITFPLGYHSGFNTGFNIAESTNFATERWIEYGKRCTKCYCKSDTVYISMETFVKRFQPDRYENWLKGKDIGRHPEEPDSKPTPAPPPSIDEYIQNDKDRPIPDYMLEQKNKKRRHPIHKKHSGDDDDEYNDVCGDEDDAKYDVKVKIRDIGDQFCKEALEQMWNKRKRKSSQSTTESDSPKKISKIANGLSLYEIAKDQKFNPMVLLTDVRQPVPQSDLKILPPLKTDPTPDVNDLLRVAAANNSPPELGNASSKASSTSMKEKWVSSFSNVPIRKPQLTQLTPEPFKERTLSATISKLQNNLGKSAAANQVHQPQQQPPKNVPVPSLPPVVPREAQYNLQMGGTTSGTLPQQILSLQPIPCSTAISVRGVEGSKFPPHGLNSGQANLTASMHQFPPYPQHQQFHQNHQQQPQGYQPLNGHPPQYHQTQPHYQYNHYGQQQQFHQQQQPQQFHHVQAFYPHQQPRYQPTPSQQPVPPRLSSLQPLQSQPQVALQVPELPAGIKQLLDQPLPPPGLATSNASSAPAKATSLAPDPTQVLHQHGPATGEHKVQTTF